MNLHMRVHWTWSRDKLLRSTVRHTITQLWKPKTEIPETSKGEGSHSVQGGFSKIGSWLPIRRGWCIQGAEGKNCQPRILYLASLSFIWRMKGKLRHLQILSKLREFIIFRPAWQEMLKGALQAEMKGHQPVPRSCLKTYRLLVKGGA